MPGMTKFKGKWALKEISAFPNKDIPISKTKASLFFHVYWFPIKKPV